jgi:hypothetical protein
MARSLAESRPVLTQEFAVQAEQGGWGKHQPPGRKLQAQSGEDKAIGRNELRPFHLTAQNSHLMAESEDLGSRSESELVASVARLIASRTST